MKKSWLSKLFFGVDVVEFSDGIKRIEREIESIEDFERSTSVGDTDIHWFNKFSLNNERRKKLTDLANSFISVTLSTDLYHRFISKGINVKHPLSFLFKRGVVSMITVSFAIFCFVSVMDRINISEAFSKNLSQQYEEISSKKERAVTVSEKEAVNLLIARYNNSWLKYIPEERGNLKQLDRIVISKEDYEKQVAEDRRIKLEAAYNKALKQRLNASAFCKSSVSMDEIVKCVDAANSVIVDYNNMFDNSSADIRKNVERINVLVFGH